MKQSMKAAILKTSRADAAFAALFMAVSIVPLVGVLSAGQPDELETGLDIVSARTLVDEHFRDAFSFRGTLLRWNLRMRYLIFRESPVSEQAVFGKDGWLFYTSRDNGDAFRTSLFPDSLQASEITSHQKVLQAMYRVASARGIDLYTVIPPNKLSVYPHLIERKPNGDGMGGSRRYIANVLQGLGDDVLDQVIDMQPELARRHDSRWPLYYKTDTHWNRYGGFLAAQIILSRLGRDQGIIPFHPDEVAWHASRREGGDLARMVGLDDWLTDMELQTEYPFHWRRENGEVVHRFHARGYKKPGLFRTVNNEANNKLTGLVFHDSFFEHVQPFLSEKVHDCTFAWSFYFDEDLIAAVNPDFIIYEKLERYW